MKIDNKLFQKMIFCIYILVILVI